MNAYTILSLLVLISTATCTIPAPSANLEVYALPVGQGDCTVIQCPAPSGQLILNDCGSSGGAGYSAQQVLAYLGNRVNDIAAIYISHANRDHYNYLPTITDSTNMNIQSVIIGGVVANYPAAFQTWLNNFGARLRLISNGNGCIGNCAIPGSVNFCNNVNINFNVLAANIGPTSNEKSIVLKVINNQFNMLLPGDMEGNAATQIANDPGVSAQLQSRIYKMAHHGASTKANMPVWLQAIRPTQAFASNGYNFGNCKHPRCDTITRIQALNTIQPAPAHAFYCGVPLTNYPNFAEDMYETSPTANMICLLTYTSAGTFNQNCMAPPPRAIEVPEEFEDIMSPDDDECDDDLQEEENSAANLCAPFSVFLMLVLLVSLAIV